MRRKIWLPFGWRLTLIYRPGGTPPIGQTVAIAVGFFSTLALLRLIN